MQSVKSFVVALHRNEEGMETVQIIMIMAIAAMVLTGVNQVVGVSADKGNGGSQGGGLLGGVTNGIGKLLGGMSGGFGLGGIGKLIGGLF